MAARKTSGGCAVAIRKTTQITALAYRRKFKRITTASARSTKSRGRWRKESLLNRLSRGAQNEGKHLGDGAVERLRDRVLEFDVGERFGQRGILLERNAVGL